MKLNLSLMKFKNISMSISIVAITLITVIACNKEDEIDCFVCNNVTICQDEYEANNDKLIEDCKNTGESEEVCKTRVVPWTEYKSRCSD